MTRRMHQTITALTLASFALAVSPSRADTPGEAGVDWLFLLQDCAAAGKTLGTDCYESVSALTNKLWGAGGLAPTDAAPVVVDIGVGTFDGPLECTDAGHVTFRGVGRDRTRITDVPEPGNFLPAAIRVENCDGLEFQDLTAIGDETASGFPIAVAWSGSGTSTWTDVDLRASYAGWFDSGSCSTGFTEHYFFGSKIISSGSYGYLAQCGEHWIYGSEVRMEAENNALLAVPRHGVLVDKEGDVRLFGSSIRSHPGTGFTQNLDFVGVSVGETQNGGIFHMHGGIISVSAETAGKDAIGIDAVGTTGFSHTLETAFVVKEGTGSAIRIRGPGIVKSPLLWESGTDAPGGGVVSKTGKDIFVETDCDASGCSGSGTQPHLMIYSEACGASNPWYDTVRAACRN